MTEVHEALRRWAKGLYTLEAGVELLVRAFDGRFANPGQPWVQQGDAPGWWWIDIDHLNDDNYGALSGGETRLLRLAASLLGGPPVDLSRNLAGLDREHVQLVLTGIEHASGSHESNAGLSRKPTVHATAEVNDDQGSTIPRSITMCARSSTTFASAVIAPACQVTTSRSAP